ncbi:MAG: hypothetical protein ABID63_10605 [Pseudomonadota bacterium]
MSRFAQPFWPVSRLLPMAVLCGLSLVIFPGDRAHALEPAKARQIIDAILMQHGIDATERDMQTENGAVTLHYDDVRLNLSGYSAARELVMSDVAVTLRDTGNPDIVDIDVTLPETARMLAEKTTDAREITLRDAQGTLAWNHVTATPKSFNAAAAMLVGDEPVSRKHWLMNNLKVLLNETRATISWGASEWTGANREKMGAVQSASFDLYPGPDGETRLDYAHDGLWLPNLIQPRTVRLQTHSAGVKWTEARPILQQGINDMMTGKSPRQSRRDIGNALWRKAAASGQPILIDEIYVEGRGLEARGDGQLMARDNARYGFQGDLDVNLVGRDRLEFLIGTPASPTLLGALVPFAVEGLAAGRPGPQETTAYNIELLPDGRLIINGVTVMDRATGG